jgi:hypothetical protein
MNKPAFEQIPLIKSGERNTKNLVIMVLAGEWPLTVQDLFNAIQENYDQKITYQGVRKAVLQLERQRILEKNSKGQYKISHEWAENINKFSEEIHITSTAAGGSDILSMPQYYSRAYEFEGKPAEAYYWAAMQLVKLWDADTAKRKLVTCIQPHALPLTIVKNEEYCAVKKISTEGDHYIACPSNTPLDKLFVGVFTQIGAKTKTGCKVSKKCDLAAIKDYIIEIYLSSTTRKRIDDAFKKYKKIDDRAITAIHDSLMASNARSRVVITRNKHIAEKIRTLIMNQISLRKM